MKIFFSFFTRILITIILIGSIFVTTNVYAATTLFTRSLKVGMSGEDVRQLQLTLNLSPDTRVAQSGPGSPGLETTYFGQMTARAVVRFQEKYATDILVPIGLKTGTGYVGTATLSVLNRPVIYQKSVPQIPNQTSTSSVQKTNNTISVLTSEIKENPNKKNLDVFLSAIDRVAEKNGRSSSVTAAIKDQIRRDIATTTNLQDTFINIVQKQVSASLPTLASTPYIDDFVYNITRSLKTSFFPKKVEAQVGTDFGGALLFSFFCNCSANWLLTITPLPPTFATLLTYQTGSQAFLSYNIPITTWLLGKYQTGAGICLIYVGTGCADLPSEGMITPFVGSSPI